LFLDISAAFDALDHRILLNKARDVFGISGGALDWDASYLSERNSYILYKGSASVTVAMTCGDK